MQRIRIDFNDPPSSKTFGLKEMYRINFEAELNKNIDTNTLIDGEVVEIFEEEEGVTCKAHLVRVTDSEWDVVVIEETFNFPDKKLSRDD